MTYAIGGRDQISLAEFEVKFGVSQDTETGGALNPLRPTHIGQLQPDLASSSIRATLTTTNQDPRSAYIVLTRKDNPFVEWDGALFFLPYDVTEINERTISREFDRKPDANIIGATARHYMPLDVWYRYDKAKEKARAISELLCAESGYTRPLIMYERIISMDEVLPYQVVDILQERFTQPLLEERDDQKVTVTTLRNAIRRRRPPFVRPSAEPPLSLVDLQPRVEEVLLHEFVSEAAIDQAIPRDVMAAAEYARFFFMSAVRYLGPLRDAPKPIYPLEALANPTEVGYKAEHTAAVLHLHRYTNITYIPSSFVANLDKAALPITTTLPNAVADWLGYLGVVQELSTEDQGKIGHTLRVQTQGSVEFYDLTNVGVGVSQVLPIVVMALLAGKPCLLIFEQPELHLHPRVQARLGDFFLSLGLNGKQCLVETHSEYLIERFRRRIAEAGGDSLVDTLRIYFTEHEGGQTKCRSVDVSRYGAITDYPTDFFDESQNEIEAILQAARAKRAADRHRTEEPR
jgi:hypothetical protein